MTWDIHWFVTQEIVATTCQGNIDGRELLVMTQQLLRHYLDPAPRPIHVLTDVRAVDALRFSLRQAIQNPLAATYFGHPQLGWTCYVTREHDYHAFLIASFFERKFDTQLHVAHSPDEALIWLSEQGSLS